MDRNDCKLSGQGCRFNQPGIYSREILFIFNLFFRQELPGQVFPDGKIGSDDGLDFPQDPLVDGNSFPLIVPFQDLIDDKYRHGHTGHFREEIVADFPGPVEQHHGQGNEDACPEHKIQVVFLNEFQTQENERDNL